MQNKYTYLLSLLILSLPNSADSHNFCNFTMTVRQHLYNNGFHRNLTYKLVFENHSDDNSGTQYYLYDACVLGIQQRLPAGLFVNPDELSDLRRAEKLTAFPNNGVNIEVPAEYAQPFNAYIFTQVSYSKVETWLPVHARYHRAVKGGGFAHNELGAPSVFIRCPDHRMEECDMPMKTKTYLCEKDPDRCLWKEIIPKMLNKPLDWPVPVGNLEHYYITAGLTLVAVLIASMWLIKAIHEHKVAYRQRWRF
ncbi:phosphatidylinositol-glycan biosynthesis class X protein [Epargyreus clarus]|uniref:phosphatidylinositol-glycan biosynthesis class X protein n=1 Tax=Epargyreus clarus TaxID=520877 RepID=UPI003C2F1D0B